MSQRQGPSANHLIAPPRSARRCVFVAIRGKIDDQQIIRKQQIKHHRQGKGTSFQGRQGRILQGLVHSAEKIGQPDDGDEGYVLEQIDDRIDDAGQRDPESLRPGSANACSCHQ